MTFKCLTCLNLQKNDEGECYKDKSHPVVVLAHE